MGEANSTRLYEQTAPEEQTGRSAIAYRDLSRPRLPRCLREARLPAGPARLARSGDLALNHYQGTLPYLVPSTRSPLSQHQHRATSGFVLSE